MCYCFLLLFVVVVVDVVWGGSLLIFRGHSTREPAASRVTYFILRAYTGTGVSQSQHRKKSGEVSEKMQVNGLEG